MNNDYARKDVNGPDIVDGTGDDLDMPVDQMIITETPADEISADEIGTSKSMRDQAPMSESLPHDAPLGAKAGALVALLSPEDSEHFRTMWNEVQGKFVDEPRAAVQQADSLVSDVIAKMTQMFANEHSSLEGQWKEGKEVSTEDLRQALVRYRSFFKRLVV